MVSSVRDFILVLQVFFPGAILRHQALNVVATISAVFPLFKLHQNQRLQPRQPAQTGWFKSIVSIISTAFEAEDTPELEFLVAAAAENNIPPETLLSRGIAGDIDEIYEFLAIDDTSDPNHFFPSPARILVTHRKNCVICPSDEVNTLRRKDHPQFVRLLNENYKWCEAYIFVGHCPRCNSDYYPDKYTFTRDDLRYQQLEYSTQYLRVSKAGIWVHRSIAVAQERAIFRFHCGWSNFANWLNDILDPEQPRITNRQAQKLFLEHMGRRLLIAHEKHEDFACGAHPSSASFAEAIREVIGEDGGAIPSSLHHGCIECTHKKRYRADLIAEGANIDGDGQGVAGIPEGDIVPPNQPNQAGNPGNAVDAILPPPVQANNEREDQPRGYVRMAVMDGKSIVHRICALDTCNRPLVNYKDGRFCADHLELRNKCGIIPCGRNISDRGSVTCDDPEHQEWHRRYLQRFGRLSYPGVRRVIRRQQEEGATQGLQVHQQLPSLRDIPGNEVVHTFRAQSIYCLQTVQWACGIPVGWGKCYKSESSPQVLQILDRFWEEQDDLRPSFIAYDNACDLLRHIVTQNPDSAWLKSTKFVVDAWHYIGHRATDMLCRLWCNPAPTNGSQPDLVLTVTDDTGQQHTARAFNTETAEQLNSWLDGFESQLRQMSAVNYDIFVHVLMLLFKEDVEGRIQKKNLELPGEFWEVE